MELHCLEREIPPVHYHPVLSTAFPQVRLHNTCDTWILKLFLWLFMSSLKHYQSSLTYDKKENPEQQSSEYTSTENKAGMLIQFHGHLEKVKDGFLHLSYVILDNNKKMISRFLFRAHSCSCCAFVGGFFFFFLAIAKSERFYNIVLNWQVMHLVKRLKLTFVLKFYFLGSGSSWFQRLLKSWLKYQFCYFGNIECQQHNEVVILFLFTRVTFCCTEIVIVNTS